MLNEQLLSHIAASDAAKRARQPAAPASPEMLPPSMSHELRTPLNAIIGFAQLLEVDDTLRDDQRECVQEILQASRHLLSLINKALEFSRLDAATRSIALSQEEVDLPRLLQECVQLVQPLTREAGVRILPIEAGLGRLRIKGDALRLRQVFLNLLSNAIKYNRPGGDVRIRVSHVQKSLRVIVEDTGHGIPETRLSELFLPFSRLGAERSETEGTGLGLALTKSLVEAMGGSMGVVSTLGVGTAFWVDVPMEAGRA